jgi:SPFH domain / Band 7 family
VAYFRVFDAEASVLEVIDVHEAVQQLMQTQLRDVLCQQEFNEILEQRDALSHKIRDEVAHAADRWGVVIERVQMKNIDLVDPNMVCICVCVCVCVCVFVLRRRLLLRRRRLLLLLLLCVCVSLLACAFLPL